MNRELARKRPAIVISAEPIEARPIASADTLILRHTNRTQLAAEITRRWQAGEIRRDYDLGRQGNIWVARCRVVPPASRMRRVCVPVLVAGAALGLSGAGLWLLTRALVAILPVALGVLALLALVAAVSGNTTIIQKVTVNR